MTKPLPQPKEVVDDISLFVHQSKQHVQKNETLTTAIQQVFGLQSSTIQSVIKTMEGYQSIDSNTTVCIRCGRSNHTVEKCSANKDIFGIICPPKKHTNPLKRKDKDFERVQKKHANQERYLQQRKASIPCKLWEQGKCLLSNQCRFSHDGPGYDPRSKQLCEYYRVGTCTRGDLCFYSHKKSDFPCVFFHLKKKCKKINCEYSHRPLTKEQLEQLERDEARYQERHAKKKQPDSSIDDTCKKF